MDICITATADSLDSKIDERFGRCAFFIFVDPETMRFKAMPNPALNESGGVGIKAASAVLQHKPAAVITGLIGDNAIKVFQASDAIVYACKNGTVREAAEMYKAGRLERLSASNN